MPVEPVPINCPRCERAVAAVFEPWTTARGEMAVDAVCPRCRLLLAADLASDEPTLKEPHQC